MPAKTISLKEQYRRKHGLASNGIYFLNGEFYRITPGAIPLRNVKDQAKARMIFHLKNATLAAQYLRDLA